MNIVTTRIMSLTFKSVLFSVLTVQVLTVTTSFDGIPIKTK